MKIMIAVVHKLIKKKIWLSFGAILLFTLTYLFNSKGYYLGGDDTKLYYLYPSEMLRGFILNIVTNNTLGTMNIYGAPSAFAPIFSIIYIVKLLLPFTNTQAFMLSLNLLLGVFFFYRFLSLFLDNKSSEFFFDGKLLASLSYVFSYYLFQTVYNHQLLSIYIVSVFPATLYYFFRGVNEKDIRYTIISAIIFTLCSGTLMTLPWFGAALVGIIPLIAYLIYTDRYLFIRHFLVWIFLFFLMNIYWLAHLIYPSFIGNKETSVTNIVISEALKRQNIDLINALVRLNEPYHQIASFLRTSWSDKYYMSFSQSYGIIYLGVILLAGLYLKRVSKKLKIIYLIGLCCLIISMIFVTPNFGRWNTELFIFLNNTIPLFTMFRNMYDKFAFAMAFSYAFTFGISLWILEKTISKAKIVIIFVLIFIGITVNGVQIYQSSRSNVTLNGISGKFNKDFVELKEYVSHHRDDGKYVWLPLNTPSYVYISDAEQPDHYYYGASPMQFLAGVSDLTGLLSFSTSRHPELNNTILNMLRKKKYTEVGKIFQILNVHHIIINNDTIPTWGKNHLNESGELELQNDEFKSVILGELVRKFGDRYSLYQINSSFSNETLFTAEMPEGYPIIRNPVSYKKVSEGIYDIKMNFPGNTTNLYFQESFSPYWKLESTDGRTIVSNHTRVFDFGNMWKVSKRSKIVLNGQYSFRLLFEPTVLITPSYVLSIGALVMCLLYVVVKSVKRATNG